MNDLNLKEYNVVLDCPLCDKKALHIVKSSGGTMQCLNCGYVTADKFIGTKESNDAFKELDENMQKMSKEAKGKIWIPTVLTLNNGLLSPILADGNLFWSFVPLVKIEEEEKENFPLEDGSGFYEHKYDTAKTVLYSIFADAIKEIKEIQEGKRTIDTKEPIEMPKLKRI